MRVKKDGGFGLSLGDLRPQFRLTKLTRGPGSVKALDVLIPKTFPGVPEELQILRHRDDVFVVVPLAANPEITQDFVGYIRL